MDIKQNPEMVGLIRDQDNDTQSENDTHFAPHRQPGFLKRNDCRALSLHLALIILYTGLFLVISAGYCHNTTSIASHLVYSPARAAVKYVKQRFDAELVIDSNYIGDPNAASDLAWHNLLENMNIAVPASDLEKIHSSSIGVPSEPGMYIAGLSVFHELHCLKRLRQATWLDVYFPNQTMEEARLQRLHTGMQSQYIKMGENSTDYGFDHCIDVLRQAILCRADVSLFTLQWSEGQPEPRADFSHEHECVDWSALNAWAAERAVPEEKMKRLEHPIFGSAFPDGEGSLLGASEDHSPTVHETI